MQGPQLLFHDLCLFVTHRTLLKGSEHGSAFVKVIYIYISL